MLYHKTSYPKGKGGWRIYSRWTSEGSDMPHYLTAKVDTVTEVVDTVTVTYIGVVNITAPLRITLDL